MANITENQLEQTTLNWFLGLGYNIAFGPNISPDGQIRECQDYDQILLQVDNS